MLAFINNFYNIYMRLGNLDLKGLQLTGLSHLFNECFYRSIKMIEEVWKPVLGFENSYKVSNIGNVFSIKNNKVLSLWKDKDGYHRCNLKSKGKAKQASVHRLVAESFIMNPNNKTQINHKNAIRSDNRVENLEWCSCAENQRYKYALGYKPSKEVIQKMQEGHLKRISKPEEKEKMALLCKNRFSVKVLDITTGIVYSSQAEAAKSLNLSQGNISSVCLGKRKSVKGHIFKFAEGKEDVQNFKLHC